MGESNQSTPHSRDVGRQIFNLYDRMLLLLLGWVELFASGRPSRRFFISAEIALSCPLSRALRAILTKMSSSDWM
jgi:hypothetical protein